MILLVIMLRRDRTGWAEAGDMLKTSMVTQVKDDGIQSKVVIYRQN